MTNKRVDPFGIVWNDGGEATDDHLGFSGEHESELLNLAFQLLPQDGVFLDVGAHVGLWTLRMAWKASTVFAIEANALTYDTLLENIANNEGRIPATIHALNVAAWDSFETLSLVDENNKLTGGSTRCEPDVQTDDVKALGMPLDAVLPEGYTINLVKIDVEGAEARVLRGLAHRIIEDKPTLIVEMHDQVYDLPSLRDEVLDLLTRLGYGWNDQMTYRSAYYLIARPKTSDELSIEIVKAGEE